MIFDSLYACENVFKICKKNNWEYLIRFEEGSIKTLAENFNGLKLLGTTYELNNKDKCIFENELEYREFNLHLVEYTTKNVQYPFCIYIFYPVF